MHLPWLAFLTPFFLLATTAHSSSGCPTVRIDLDEPSAQGIPVWNQTTSSCYVYSSSYLATLWMRQNWSQTLPELVSFVDQPAAVYKAIRKSPEKKRIRDAENGRTCMALDWNLRQKAETLGERGIRGLPLPSCEMYGLVRGETDQTLRPPFEIRARMHELLEDSSTPFAIEYCAGVHHKSYDSSDLIKNRTFDQTLTYLNTRKAKKNFSRKCGFHSAVVVGQKSSGGKCYFRIRNSWGTAFNGPFKPGWDGHHWVEADVLAKNTLRVISVK